MKATWSVVIMILSIALIGCQAPMVEVDATPEPTMVMTAVPTAMPKAEPPKVWDVKACEEKLEALIGQDVTYDKEMLGLQGYRFELGEDSYLIGYDGEVKIAMHHKKGMKLPQKLELERAKELVYEEAKLYAPSFFDHEILEECHVHEWSVTIYLYQLSSKGNRTGNSIDAHVEGDGSIRSMTIHNTEDIAVADQPVNIDEARAIELAYEAAEVYALQLREEWLEQATAPIDPSLIKPTDDEPFYNDQGELVEKNDEEYEYIPLEVYFDDREEHEVIATLTVWRGRRLWHVNINHVLTNQEPHPFEDKHTMGFCATIDAMTGEALGVGHGGH